MGQNFPLYSLIAYNTGGRRVFGYLRALGDGCQVMISIDDDNFPTQDDFVGGHLRNVAFGRPLVDHRRNPHNYVDDLR